MLEELELRDLGPIDSATITPAPSMTAITGETGAGKSMLLNALRMISGGTADASRVASGADQAWAQGIFALGERDPLRAMLAEAGIPVDDDGLFLSRSVPAKGRSRSVLCGKSVPRSLLGEVASNLITIHGQTDQLRIASMPAMTRPVNRSTNPMRNTAVCASGCAGCRRRSRPCASRRTISGIP